MTTETTPNFEAQNGSTKSALVARIARIAGQSAFLPTGPRPIR